jgi:hypothetical protein
MNEKVTGHKMLKVRAILWHQLKILAVKNNMPLQDLTDRALSQWLKYSPTFTSKDNGK